MYQHTYIDRSKKKNINKKFLRENLIQNFILKKGKQYNIKLEHQKNLISFLYIAFLFKSITISDIHFENSEIAGCGSRGWL